MDQKLIKVFKNSVYKSEDNLSSLVWEKIMKREKRITYIKMWVFSCAGITSLVSFTLVFKTLLNDLVTSGFYEYTSLAFSSDGAFVSYWKELTLSISESLPITNIIYTFVLVFIFLLSLRYFIKQIIRNQLTTLQVRPV